MSGRASITVLALDRSEQQALMDWSRGLDWVRWMLGDVRSQLEVISTGERAPYEASEVKGAWADFAKRRFEPVLGPRLRESWEAAQAGQTRQLQEVAARLEGDLDGELRERSGLAARILLRSTRGAVFQETLGKHRAAIEEGRCPAHLVCVWAAVGSLFQLGLANVVAEYLRLEWAMLSRHCADVAEPEGALSLVSLTSGVLVGSGMGAFGIERMQEA